MQFRAIALVCWTSLLPSCGARPAEPLSMPPPDLAAPSETAVPLAQAEPADGAGTASPDATTSPAPPPTEPAAPEPPPAVEVSAPSFVGDGTIPDVEAFLDGTRDGAARCVADHGGLSTDAGEMKVQFLVSLRAKAEGVDVLSSKGVSEEAERCLRTFLKDRRVGTPTADPVGVQFRYRFVKAPRGR